MTDTELLAKWDASTQLERASLVGQYDRRLTDALAARRVQPEVKSPELVALEAEHAKAEAAVLTQYESLRERDQFAASHFLLANQAAIVNARQRARGK